MISTTDSAVGLRLYLAAVLLVAASSKVRNVESFELVLVQLFGIRLFTYWRHGHSRFVAKTLICYEIVLSILVIVNPIEHPVTVALIATMTMFLLIVGRAFAIHVSCGCFRSRRPTELSNLLRSSLLVMCSVALIMVEGSSSVGGKVHWLMSLCVAAGLAGAIECAVTIAKHGARLGKGSAAKQRRERDSPLSIPVSLIPNDQLDQVSKGARVRLERAGWIEVVDLARSTRIPVSTIVYAAQGSIRVGTRRDG